jgi:type IV pilus assembly protein PilZ
MLQRRCGRAEVYALAPETPGSEKRMEQRSAIELQVDYKRLNSFFADYTKNISKGGTFIRTAKPLPEGTTFHFKISVPGMSEPFALTGEVAWTREVGDSPGMGIKFLYENDSQRGAFESVVEKLMERSLGPMLVSRLLGKK